MGVNHAGHSVLFFLSRTLSLYYCVRADCALLYICFPLSLCHSCLATSTLRYLVSRGATATATAMCTRTAPRYSSHLGRRSFVLPDLLSRERQDWPVPFRTGDGGWRNIQMYTVTKKYFSLRSIFFFFFNNFIPIYVRMCCCKLLLFSVEYNLFLL